MKRAMGDCTFEEYVDFKARIFRRVKFTTLMIGNLTKETCLELSEKFFNDFKQTFSSKE